MDTCPRSQDGASAPLTILCAGAYGTCNAGDDLPLIALAEGVRRRLPGREVRFRVLSRHPDPWEEQAYGVTMAPNLEHATSAAARGRWFRGLNPDDDPEPFERVRAEIRACDLLVLGAGSLLTDGTIGLLRGPAPLMALYGALARLYDKPVMLYGMSLGPLTTEWGRDLSRRLIADARLVTVRDQASLDLCRELLKTPRDIHLLPEAALATEPAGPARGFEILAEEGVRLRDDRPVIALGLRDLARPLGDEAGTRQETAVRELLDRWRDRATFLFISQSTYAEDDDRMLAARLAGCAPDGCRCIVVRQRRHPRDLVALYGLADVTIASRLHAAVFSSMAGTPVVGVDYLPKMRAFLETVACCGECLAMTDLTVEGMTDAAGKLLAAGPRLREELHRRVNELRAEAGAYARLAISEGLGLGAAEVGA
jgi:colanic acid/amylovoran biosynthesis protein